MTHTSGQTDKQKDGAGTLQATPKSWLPMQAGDLSEVGLVSKADMGSSGHLALCTAEMPTDLRMSHAEPRAE